MEKDTNTLASTSSTKVSKAGSGLMTDAQTSEAIRPFRFHASQADLDDLQRRRSSLIKYSFLFSAHGKVEVASVLAFVNKL